MNIENPKMSPEREQEFIARFNEPEENYNLLHENAQKQAETSSITNRLDTDGILQYYVKFTDKIIGVADGSIHTRDFDDPRNPEHSQQKPDTLIFLDKSARPVADFVDALWDQFAKEGSEKPTYDFLNIDRVNWFMKQDNSRVDAETVLGPSDFDINKVSDEDIASIRVLYVTGELTEENWQEEVMHLPTTLDGKNIVIIDEVKSQGGTLSIATQLLRRAIPEATVSGKYFWETSYKKMADDKLKADSVPVWYSKESAMGRGVGDISKTYYEHQYRQDDSQENLRRKIGWSVLSAPHHMLEADGTLTHLEDEKYKKLLQDISYLSYAVADGRILRGPDTDRDEDEQDEIIDKQGVTHREASQWRVESKRIKHRANAQKFVKPLE